VSENIVEFSCKISNFQGMEMVSKYSTKHYSFPSFQKFSPLSLPIEKVNGRFNKFPPYSGFNILAKIQNILRRKCQES
jgi:hypothetical protein